MGFKTNSYERARYECMRKRGEKLVLEGHAEDDEYKIKCGQRLVDKYNDYIDYLIYEETPSEDDV